MCDKFAWHLIPILPNLAFLKMRCKKQPRWSSERLLVCINSFINDYIHMIYKMKDMHIPPWNPLPYVTKVLRSALVTRYCIGDLNTRYKSVGPEYPQKPCSCHCVRMMTANLGIYETFIEKRTFLSWYTKTEIQFSSLVARNTTPCCIVKLDSR